jgi:hypothetical protein
MINWAVRRPKELAKSPHVFFSYYFSGAYNHPLPPIARHFYPCMERMFPKLRATAVRFDHSQYPLESRTRRKARNVPCSGLPSNYEGLSFEEILESIGRGVEVLRDPVEAGPITPPERG